METIHYKGKFYSMPPHNKYTLNKYSKATNSHFSKFSINVQNKIKIVILRIPSSWRPHTLYFHCTGFCCLPIIVSDHLLACCVHLQDLLSLQLFHSAHLLAFLLLGEVLATLFIQLPLLLLHPVHATAPPLLPIPTVSARHPSLLHHAQAHLVARPTWWPRHTLKS